MNRAEFKWGRLSRKQKQVLVWWRPKSRYSDYDGIICDGSIRSGKTVSMGFSYVIWAMSTYDRENFGMCGKTIEAFRRNVLATLKRQLRSRGYGVTERRTENLVVISKGGRANMFYIFGGKDERSQDLIQGITLAGVLFDEVAIMPESFVMQATARCSVEGSKWWFNCNPAGPNHWFKIKWINKAREKRIVYLHFTMTDNLTLSKSIKIRYARQYAGVFYKRFILGLWVVAEGIIYDMFDRKKHVIRIPPEQLEQEFFISSDFGIQNANVWLKWHRIKDTNRWHEVAESVYSGRDEKRQKTVKELADALDELCGNRKPKAVIIDPSAAAMKAELKRRGYKVLSADNDVVDGISDVQTMLSEGRLSIDSSCKHTKTEYESYAWDSKAADRGEDKPLKVSDHCMDATRYFVRTMRLVKRDKTQKQQEDGLFML